MVEASTIFESMTLAELEKWAIESAMERYNHSIRKTARKLEMGRSTLYRKLRQYGWEQPDGWRRPQ